MKRLVLLVLVVFILSPVATAQEVLRIAAVVNDEAISALDLEQRLTLLLATANLPDRAEVRRRFRGQVLDDLINERLQLQEAARLGIRVAEQDIDTRIVQIEDQFGLGRGGMERFLRTLGLERSAITIQIRAQLAWNKIITTRLLPNVVVGEDEVDAVIERMRENEGQPQSRVLEIFLSVDTPDKKQEISQTARRLVEQLRGGAQFEVIAREFSQGSTAGQGGELGWIQHGQLTPDLGKAVAALAVGEVSDPILYAGGVYIMKVVERRSSTGDEGDGVQLHLAQVVFTLPADAATTEVRRIQRQAETVAQRIDGCANAVDVATEVGAPASGDLGTVALKDMPPQIAQVVGSLDVGAPSEPVQVGDALHVFVVCERIEPEPQGPNRTLILDAIGRDRLTMMARRYLRDLRREAFLDDSRL